MNTKKRSQAQPFYNKPLSNYQIALIKNLSIWDTVKWDLSTTLFKMAILLQAYPRIENNVL